nr:uncharacterized protein LOC105339048 isoform X2 [Crassostrea gigas]
MTAALTFLCVVSVWSGVLSDVHVGGIGLPQTVGTELGVADTRLKYVQSTVTGSCRCGGSSCQCCQTIRVLTEKEDVCIKVQYLKKNSGVLLTVTWGGKVVYSKEVSVRNPPAICLKVPFLKKVGKLCVQLYNMNVGKSGLSGCARISLKVAFFKVVKVELGCFKIPFAKDEIMEVTAGSKMGVLLRNRERDLEMKRFAIYLKHLFRADQ